MIDKARELALKVLYEIDKNKGYSNIVLDDKLAEARKRKLEINDKDIGFISEIVYGTVSWKLTIDEIIKKHSNIKMKKISPWILNILRMSIYQIVFLDRVPKSAAVNEGVNLAKRYGHKASSNFVNAILRKVEKSDYEEFFLIKNDITRIAKSRSMPLWLVKELINDNNIEDVEKFCKASNLKPYLQIRVNRLKTNKENLIEELKREGVEVDEGIVDNFLILHNAKNIEGKKSFKEGEFTVQDEAAGLIPIILNPKEDESVLDACSSPGGKTTFMAELMNNKGKITAWDLHEHRVTLVDNAAKRLGIDIIKTDVKDATIFLEDCFESFDKILLDVPCLGLGVMKRKPDIKWQRKKEDIKEIVNTQEKILENCSKYLKYEGELVYSTCSILKEENENVIHNFLQKNINFEIVKIQVSNSFFKKYIQSEGFLRVYPNENTDGFFICKMKKNKKKK